VVKTVKIGNLYVVSVGGVKVSVSLRYVRVVCGFKEVVRSLWKEIFRYSSWAELSDCVQNVH
jgi:hypothetical protein